MSRGGMPGSRQRKKWCGRGLIAAALALALLAGGCSSGGIFGGPPAPPPGSAPVAPGLSEKVSSFFSGSTARAPQTVVGAQPDINCPVVEVRRGASTLTIAPPGDKSAMTLKYQGEFTRQARECSIVNGNMYMKIGVQGRIVIGPAGGPGQVDVPLRLAVVEETPAGSKPIATKFIIIPVAIASAEAALFTHVEDAMSFPVPTPPALLEDYVVYVGFDPQSAEAQAKEKPKAKPKPKVKPKPSAG